jgi:DNA-binding NarL/FixJ family response regulator
MSTRILVADGAELMRYGAGRLIESTEGLSLAGEAATGAQALALAESLRPDVVTVPVDLPDTSGFDVCRQLRADRPDIGIVLLSLRDEDQRLLSALDSGASGYVLMTGPVADLVAAIRHAAACPRSFVANDLAAVLLRRSEQDRRPRLSPRERELLRLLKEGLPISAIAGELFISPSTVKSHLARVYEKLGAHNRTQALVAAMAAGVFVEFDERVA